MLVTNRAFSSLRSGTIRAKHTCRSALTFGKMKTRHGIGLLVCALIIAAFQYTGRVWSLADFHPGSDVVVSKEKRRIAEIGSAMSKPFDVPLLWISSRTTGYLDLLPIIQWVVLPLAYGAIIYCPVAYALRKKHTPAI